MKHTYHKLNLDCLVILGGNGTQKTANLLREEGLNIVTLAQDHRQRHLGNGHDLRISECCGDRYQRPSTASTPRPASHGRVFIVEVMGHKVGWLTLHAGIAGGADIILLPEIPYNIDKVIEAIERRNQAGKRFTILAVAEGAISQEDAALSKKEHKKKLEAAKYPSISYELAQQIQERSGVGGADHRAWTHPERRKSMSLRPRAVHKTGRQGGGADHERRLWLYGFREE